MEEFELKQALLGLNPFILIEFTSVDEETGEVGLSVEYGGGITADVVPDLLEEVRVTVEAQLG